MLLILLQLTLS